MSIFLRARWIDRLQAATPLHLSVGCPSINDSFDLRCSAKRSNPTQTDALQMVPCRPTWNCQADLESGCGNTPLRRRDVQPSLEIRELSQDLTQVSFNR